MAAELAASGRARGRGSAGSGLHRAAAPPDARGRCGHRCRARAAARPRAPPRRGLCPLAPVATAAAPGRVRRGSRDGGRPHRSLAGRGRPATREPREDPPSLPGRASGGGRQVEEFPPETPFGSTNGGLRRLRRQRRRDDPGPLIGLHPHGLHARLPARLERSRCPCHGAIFGLAGRLANGAARVAMRRVHGRCTCLPDRTAGLVRPEVKVGGRGDLVWTAQA